MCSECGKSVFSVRSFRWEILLLFLLWLHLCSLNILYRGWRQTAPPGAEPSWSRYACPPPLRAPHRESQNVNLIEIISNRISARVFISWEMRTFQPAVDFDAELDKCNKMTESCELRAKQEGLELWRRAGPIWRAGPRQIFFSASNILFHQYSGQTRSRMRKKHFSRVVWFHNCMPLNLVSISLKDLDAFYLWFWIYVGKILHNLNLVWEGCWGSKGVKDPVWKTTKFMLMDFRQQN